MRNYHVVICFLFVIVLLAACSSADSATNLAVMDPVASPTPVATPAKDLTSSDIAKLKWIEGMWRGMDGEKPFYERYRLEGDSALVVETLTDGDPGLVEDTSRFELKDGTFGKMKGDRGSAAAYITDNAVQFVPTPAGRGNSFRFESKSADKWDAVLEWVDKEGKPQQKVYHMERWSPDKK